MKTSKYPKQISLRIVLIPEKKLSSAAIRLANQYAKYGETYYFVDGKKYLAHLTVYFGSFPITNKHKVFSVVEKISEDFSSLKLDYKLTRGLSDWIWLEFELKGDLKKMHKELLLKLRPLGKVHLYNREGNYQPHISLLRYKNKRLGYKVAKLQLRINKTVLDTRWSYLAIAESEDNGTVTELIKKYKLKK